MEDLNLNFKLEKNIYSDAIFLFATQCDLFHALPFPIRCLHHLVPQFTVSPFSPLCLLRSFAKEVADETPVL